VSLHAHAIAENGAPLNGLVGSTATMPMVFPVARSAVVMRSTSVLLPAPGGPVTPIR
jgi:hypothetical protein